MNVTPSAQEQARIRQILTGDVGQYAYFVERYQHDVLTFICRLGVGQADAEELAQDTFVRAFRGLTAFEGKSSFRTWLLRIAHRTALNHLGRAHPATVSIDDDSPRAVQACVAADYATALDADSDAALSTGREKRIQLLEAAILKLPPDDQLLLRLFYFEDQPLADIAYILDTSAGALSGRLHRIRKRLRREL